MYNSQKEMSAMSFRVRFKKRRTNSDERWFAMMRQAVLLRPVQ